MVLDLRLTRLARVNTNYDLTNEMFRSYGVSCLDEDEKDTMGASARCGRGAGRRR
jgi:hypothetical protein